MFRLKSGSPYSRRSGFFTPDFAVIASEAKQSSGPRKNWIASS
jgi:hypothetical protein